MGNVSRYQSRFRLGPEDGIKFQRVFRVLFSTSTQARKISKALSGDLQASPAVVKSKFSREHPRQSQFHEKKGIELKSLQAVEQPTSTRDAKGEIKREE